MLLFCILLLVLPACRPIPGTGVPTSPQVGTIIAQTVTAFSGQATLNAPTQTPTPVPTPTLTPEQIPDGSIPAQVAPVPVPAGAVTILLMGSDQRPKAGDFRTDTMLLIVFKTDGSVSLVSFPRDLWVYLPDQFMQRLNSAQEFGGFELVKSTFEYNFGFAPQSFVLTNFSGFRSIIDSLGGIDVLAGQALTDSRDGYPGGFTVDPGVVHMDGETVLWYVRARKTTSDLDRLRRAQEVILGVASKLFSLNGLKRIPELYAAYRSAVVTDLTLKDVVALLPRLQAVDKNKIQRYAISADQVIPFVTYSGADVLLPRPESIRLLLLQALGN